MKGTLFKNILRMIKATKSRFFSLTAIVALGVAFFIGVYSSSTVMDKSVDVYDDAYGLKDITVYSNYGFRQEDIDALKSLDVLSEVEGSYFADVIATQGQTAAVTRVHSFSADQKLNQFKLREGRMPENKYEALSEAGTTITRGFSIGSKVQLSRPDNDLDTFMDVDEVTIVGMIDTPLYMNMTKENSTLSNRPIRTYLYIPEEAFCSEYFLQVDALAEDGASYDAFSDAYFDYADEVKEEVEAFAVSQQQENFKAIKQKALEEYNDGLREYRDGEKEYNEKIADAEQQLKDAEQEIEDGKKQLEDSIELLLSGERELNEQERENRQKIEDGKAQIADGLKQIADGREQLEDLKDKRQQASDGKVQVDEALSMLEMMHTILELLPADMPVNDLISQIDEASEITEAIDQLDPDWQNKTAGELLDSIDNMITELKDTQEMLEDGLAQIRDAVTDMATDAEKKEITEAETAEAECQKGMSELREETAVLTGLDRVIPDGYDDVNIDYLMEHRDEIMDLLDRIPMERIESFETVEAALDEALNRIDESLETSDNAIEKLILQGVRDRIATIKEETPDSVLTMNPALYTAFGRELLEIIDRLHLNEDGSIHTVGDLRHAIHVRLDEDQQELDTKNEILKNAHERTDQAYNKVIDRQLNELADTEIDVLAKQQELLDGERTLNEEIAKGKKQIEDGWEEVRKGQQSLDEGIAEYEDGRKELEDAKKEGRETLDEAQQKLKDAKKTIDDLADGEWTVLNRRQHYATVTYDSTIKQMAAIGRIFPFFFLMVAVLVCLTTMARTVDEQRGEIGVLRALGYTRLQCAGKYLIYSGAATLLGEVIGVIVGMATFPLVIYNTWRMMYILPPVKLSVQWWLVLLTDAAFLAVMSLTTWFACSKDMVEVPAQLLRPKSPKLGKNMLLEKITFIWSRISFTWKVTIRNIVRYKSRFIMTVAGVAGCTALLVTGFGIKDSISGMVGKHYNEITQYDGLAYIEDSLSDTEAEKLRRQIEADEEIDLAMLFYDFNSDAYGKNDSSDSIRVQVYENGVDIVNTYDLRTRKGHHPLQLTDDGAVINEKLAERAGVKVGDTIEIKDEEGRKHTVEVSAITEMYIFHCVFMTRDYYERTVGELPVSRALAITASSEEAVHSVQKKLADTEGIDGLEFHEATLERFDTMVKSLDIIVWTIIISSMALAFVVLGNLINVNISERQREIATLKVLGFRRNEVESYIYKENNILTFFGAVAGVPLGIWLHSTIMLTVEMDYIMFGRSVNPSSMMISVGLTVLFGVLVNLSMRRRLHAIRMVESLKSVE